MHFLLSYVMTYIYMGCMVALYQGFVSANSTNVCEEDPPLCTYKYAYHDNLPPVFETTEHGRVTRHAIVFEVDASQSLCSIDPFINVEPSIPNDGITLNWHLQVGCVLTSTRIVLRPSKNLTDTSVFAYLVINKCTVYWKDLSMMGQFIKMPVLNLYDSRDEFANGEEHYFYECIDYEESMTSGGDVAYPIVRGLGQVGTLVMLWCFCIGSHPLLLNHSWPTMAEVTLDGWVILR